MSITPVYSQRFIEVLDLANSGFTYTVPAGFRAVFKQLSVVNKSGILGTIFQAGGNIGQTWALNAAEGLVGPYEYQWYGQQVFFPGDVVTVNAAGDPLDITASGFLLTLP